MDVDSADASEHEMSSFVWVEEEELITPEAKLEALPWTMAEELVAGHMAVAEAPHALTIPRGFRLAMATLILTLLAAPMAHKAQSSLSGRMQASKMSRYE